MKSIIVSILLLISIKGFSQQYQVRQLSQEKVEKGAISDDEIAIINTSQSLVQIQCSIDKLKWDIQKILPMSGIALNITSDLSAVFTKICNTISSRTNCTIYKLSPATKYLIKKDDESNLILNKSVK